METMYKDLKRFVEELKVYPPAEIFFEKYGKEAKAEERIKDHCESVYRFCFPDGKTNHLAEFSAAWRDLEVLYIVGFEGMKSSAVTETKDKFLNAVKSLLPEIEALSKKDQLLKQHFESRTLKFQTIKSMVYDLTRNYCD